MNPPSLQLGTADNALESAAATGVWGKQIGWQTHGVLSQNNFLSASVLAAAAEDATTAAASETSCTAPLVA